MNAYNLRETFCPRSVVNSTLYVPCALNVFHQTEHFFLFSFPFFLTPSSAFFFFLLIIYIFFSLSLSFTNKYYRFDVRGGR